MTNPEQKREQDWALVEEIRAGHLPAWHRFIEEFGSLLLAVLRNHLRRDEDEVRTAFAEVLEHLYRTGFRTYAGRAALSTWLVIVARGIAVDHVRRIRGRPGLPEAVAKLSALDRLVFDLHYRRGQSADEVLIRLRARGHSLSMSHLRESMRRIEERLDRHTLRRLAYDIEASSVGAVSGRLLEYLDRSRADSEGEERTPQQELLERETRDRIARIQAMVDELPAIEGEVVRRHVLAHRGAKLVATEMGLSSPRVVYTLLDRALRRLRRWIEAKEARL